MKKRTDPELVEALRTLAATIQSYDGVPNEILSETADRLDELTRWIPLSERIPAQNELVVLLERDGPTTIAFLNGQNWQKQLPGVLQTHWLSLPRALPR